MSKTFSFRIPKWYEDPEFWKMGLVALAKTCLNVLNLIAILEISIRYLQFRGVI